MATIGIKTGGHTPRASTRMEKPPSMHIPQQRRDYSKAGFAAENPLGNPQRTPGFGSTGLPPGLPGE